MLQYIYIYIYYLNKCESERDDELFFASKVNNQTNSHRIIDK